MKTAPAGDEAVYFPWLVGLKVYERLDIMPIWYVWHVVCGELFVSNRFNISIHY